MLYLCYLFLFTYKDVKHHFPIKRMCRLPLSRQRSIEDQELLTGPKHIRVPQLVEFVFLYQSFCAVLYRSLFLSVCLFSIAIMCVLRITTSDYPFDIFIIVLQIEHTPLPNGKQK